MDDTEIDLSNMNVEQACMWLLSSLDTLQFEHYAYTIPFSSYVMTWHKAVPLNSIIILQSPYPNPIFPPIAAAMSYDTELCKKHMKGREVPPTVQVLANDLYINAGMSKQDSITILKNGWALIDKGILMFNEAVFSMYEPEKAYIESIKQCSVIIRLLQETENYGKRTVDIYAFGESGERVGSNLCSWFKSPVVRLSKRKVTHPAGIARRFTDLDDPNCHMGTPSFSKALAKTLSNHVASMYSMGKQSEQDLRSKRLENTFNTLSTHFPTIEKSINTFMEYQTQLSNSVEDQEYKDILEKVKRAGDDFANRLRIATSIVSNVQAHGSSVAGNVSRSGPSMKTNKPSEDLLSDHTGADANTINPITTGRPVIKSKSRVPSTRVLANTDSFTNISSPPSIASIMSETVSPASISTPARGKSSLVFKPKTSRAVTPVKQMQDKNDSPIESEKAAEDTISPLSRKFGKKTIVPTSKSKLADLSTISVPQSKVDVRLSNEQLRILSSIQAIVETHKPDVLDSESYIESFEIINGDVQSKMADNSITQRFVEAINTDLKNIPGFDINKWLSSSVTDSCAIYDLCKTEFDF